MDSVRVDRRRFGVVCTPHMMRELAAGFPALASIGWPKQQPVPALDVARSTNMHGDQNLSPHPAPVDELLPEEIVLQIFELAVHTQPSGTVFRVAGVCRRWRAYALNYPRLWAVLKVGSDSPILQFAQFGLELAAERALNAYTSTTIRLQLDRSRHWPLDVDIEASAHSSSLMATAALALATAQSRWRTLVLRIRRREDIDKFFGACQGPSLMLEKLLIIGQGSEAPLVFSGKALAAALLPAKSLRHLECIDCVPRFSRGDTWVDAEGNTRALFSGVTSLHITRPPAGLPAQRWQRLLRTFPRLRDFQLLETPAHFLPERPAPFSHPHIRAFTLDTSAAGLNTLTLFSFPKLEHMTLSFPLLDVRNAPRVRGALYKFLERTPTPHFTFQWPEDRDAIWSFQYDSATAFEEFCGMAFSATGLQHLTIELRGHHGPWQQLLKYLDELTPELARSLGAPELQKLELSFRRPESSSVEAWDPIDELVRVAADYPMWEIVLYGPDKQPFALWAVLEDPSKPVVEFSLSKWLIS
ncbi:hypothetical protein EXIGLDRAFT_273705 [Exidia glandulosa HHB12029]|uniref:F-box domain-containing protein n=1 Tax=Exidia glandulosa HHB12029 TaxID=1314781 RepID=A0A165M734_EXIGL|nr:hypothetical protein EXIGLDRAFT_273705 [Exidia glandulosa HHB12029]